MWPPGWRHGVKGRMGLPVWEILKDEFVGTFSLVGGTEALDEALQDIDALVFDESHPCAAQGAPTWETQMQDIVNCHNLSMEECDEDPRNVSIPELEGEGTVGRPPL